MKIFRKIAAALSAAVIAVSACASMAVTAGADSIADTAKAISSGNSVTTYLPGTSDVSDYSISVKDTGMLKLSLESHIKEVNVVVYNSDGDQIKPTLYEASSGWADWNFMGTQGEWNETIEKFKGSMSYSVKKGTYYIRLSHYSSWAYNSYNQNGKVTFTATYPTGSSSKAKINYITLNLSKGDTLSLGADITGSGDVTWKSSKSSVASVSSAGKVTAKSKGSAIITAKVGKTTKKIKIVVS